MLNRLAAALSAAAVAACSVVGIRETEEPAYRVVERLSPSVEIRAYDALVVAETFVDADQMTARNRGFERVAGYIFGGNTRSDRIAMTAPVIQSAGGTQIAMTAPVIQRADGAGWRIAFVMPAGSTLAALPKPNDQAVTLREIPAATYAVLRFSGDRGPDAIREKQAALAAAIAPTPWHATGTAVAWFYDPPWTIPALRRNEVAVAVSRTAP